jgi:hypothetical protein
VILASPLVALPMGLAQTPEATPAAVVAAAPAKQLAPKVMGHEMKAGAQSQAFVAPTEISVACGGDGCVVQNGLEVMVVAGKRAR